MKQDEQSAGGLNPKAPAELARFAFLVGQWSGDAKLKRADGGTDRLKVEWDGRYVLDGYAIQDDYRMTSVAGELVVLGMNVRAYDSEKKKWNMKWLNALAGDWTDLGTDEMGGVRVDEKTISYVVKEPMAAHALTRITFTNDSAEQFTWRGEKSNDGKTWEEFLTIELHRRKN
ncbi:MAG TPA: hypothetical protein VGD60_04655 [Candidatus Acidoferrales bacterium]